MSPPSPLHLCDQCALTLLPPPSFPTRSNSSTIPTNVPTQQHTYMQTSQSSRKESTPVRGSAWGPSSQQIMSRARWAWHCLRSSRRRGEVMGVVAVEVWKCMYVWMREDCLYHMDSYGIASWDAVTCYHSVLTR